MKENSINSRSNVLKFLSNIWYIQFQSQIVYLPYIYLFPQNLERNWADISIVACISLLNSVYCLFHNDLKHHLANICSFQFRCHLLKHSDIFHDFLATYIFFFFWLLVSLTILELKKMILLTKKLYYFLRNSRDLSKWLKSNERKCQLCLQT